MYKLEIKKLTKQFGGLTAIKDMDLFIDKNEIVGIIGPNGSGKTTLFNTITGIYKPTSGKLFYEGKDITGLPPYKIMDIGISRTFQNIRIFPKMTVLENTLVGFHTRTKSTVFDSIFKTKRHLKEEKMIVQKSKEILNMIGLDDKKYEYAKNLSYGEQRKLEIARAMASEPGIILLDEPAAGMNESETLELTDFIKGLKEFGITVVLIEHDMKLVMDICERIYVIDHGIKIAEGNPEEIKNNQKVIEAYLGRRA